SEASNSGKTLTLLRNPPRPCRDRVRVAAAEPACPGDWACLGQWAVGANAHWRQSIGPRTEETPMASPVVYGHAYSTYTRTARLVLEEKGIEYELEEVDILQGAGQSPAHLARQPFGKVPAFEHDGFRLYETIAITRYIDEAFPGPKLQPADAK